MGCYVSVPYAKRRYRDPADLDEVIVPLRRFGTRRNGDSNHAPDDLAGLPSTHVHHRLASDPEKILYEAEIDQGRACRSCRPIFCWYYLPIYWVYIAMTQGLSGFSKIFKKCICDEAVCWLRKEYSTRTFFRVYSNRVEVNYPQMRFFGLCGWGSWNSDQIKVHPFDRGAAGFHPVKCGALGLLCCTWPVYGGVVARQICACNGSLWTRLFECCGWWCDEWLCDVCCCCVHKYEGLADADETSFAAGIALQAYFEGRVLTREGMEQCLQYWRENVSEMADPYNEAKRRDVCCEPFSIPLCTGERCYECTNTRRDNRWDRPFDKEDPECTPEWLEASGQHRRLNAKQVDNYKAFVGPVRNGTVCRAFGCRRVFGRRGLIFCTEGCCDAPDSSCRFMRRGEAAPPFRYRDIEDEHDASVVLRAVLGEPPANVVYRRWRWNEEDKLELQTLPAELEEGSAENVNGTECAGQKWESDTIVSPLVNTGS